MPLRSVTESEVPVSGTKWDTNPFSTRWLEVSGAADNLPKHTFKLKEELDG